MQIQTTFLCLQQQQPSYSSIFYVPATDILLYFFPFRHCSNRNDGYPALGHNVCLSNFSSDIFAVQSGECELSQEISRNTFYICISKKTTDKVSMGRWFFLNSLSRKRDFEIQSCHIWTNFLKQSVRFPLASSTASSEVFPQYFSVLLLLSELRLSKLFPQFSL